MIFKARSLPFEARQIHSSPTAGRAWMDLQGLQMAVRGLWISFMPIKLVILLL